MFYDNHATCKLTLTGTCHSLTGLLLRLNLTPGHLTVHYRYR